MSKTKTSSRERGLLFPVPNIPKGLVPAHSLLALCLFLGQVPTVEASTITTGEEPVATVIDPVGNLAFVLNRGDSTITVVDVALNAESDTILLDQADDTCEDMAWHGPTERLLVACSDGNILSVDPSSISYETVIEDSSLSFALVAADHEDAGTFGWAYETTSGALYRFEEGGTYEEEDTISVGTPVALVEKRVTGDAAGSEDDFLLLLGTTAGGDVKVASYDRGDLAAGESATWSGATATGITTSFGSEAYVTAVETSTDDGLLLQLDLSTMTFTSTAVATFTDTSATEVAMRGQWLTVLLDDTSGLTIRVFDAADASNIYDAGGAVLDSTLSAGDVMDVFLGPAATIDDLYVLATHSGGDDATGARTVEFRGSWDSPVAATYSDIDFFPSQTTSLYVHEYEPVECVDCPPKETLTRGKIDGAQPNEGTQGTATGSQVQFMTGEEIQILPIVSVPGVGMDLDLVLTYRSRADFDYRYGRGWSLNQDVRIRTETNGDKTYTNGYGRLDTYTALGGGVFVPPVHYDTTLATQAQTTTITNRFGTVSTFDASGQRTSIADRYGNTISYTWTSGKLTGITDTLNRSYTLTYDATGRLSSVTDFGSRTWTFTYDYLGQLRKVTTPATTQFAPGRTQYFSYSGNHTDSRFRSNLVQVISPLGDVVQTLTYDDYDRVVEEEIGDGTYTIEYAKPAGNLITTVEDRSGNTFEWTFSTYAMPIKKEVFTKGLRTGEPTSFVTTYGINSTTGLVDYVVHPRGNRTDYTHDSNLNLTEVRHKETNTSSSGSTDIVHAWQFGGAYNQATKYTDPLGNLTTYTVDTSGNTTQIDHPTVTSPASQSISESFTFDSLGRITSATDGTNRAVSFAYHTTGSQTGYLASVTQDPTGLALQTSFGYDAYGNVTSITDPRSKTTTITVDAENFVTEVQAPSPLSYRRRVYYDANRSVSSVEVENVDRGGTQDGTAPWIETEFDYDVLGRLLEKTVQLTASTTATTSYAYDGSGNLTQVTDPEGNDTTYAWDERHLLFKATMGEGSAVEGAIEFSYDANGSLLKSKNPRGYETTHLYDLFDRRTKTTDALSGYVTFGYDKASNLTTVQAFDSQSSLMAKTTRHFDEVNRLWKVVRDRFAPSLTTSYPTTIFTRDAAHRLVQVTDPLSNNTSYLYDMAGRLQRITDAIGNKQEYTRDANGNVTQLSVTDVPASGPAETFVTEFDFDELGRMTERREIDRLSASNVLTTTFEYDSRGNLTFRTDAEGHPVRWAYDLASRLVTYERALSVGQTIDDFVTSIEEAFAYDANGRLTTITDDNFSSTTYAYDARDRRTKTTYADTRYVSYIHDANGNLKEWADQNGTIVKLTHDALDRMTFKNVNRGTGVLGSTFELFSYDALGRMLTAQDDDYQVELGYDSVGNRLTDKQGYNVLGSERWKTVTTGFTDAGSVSSVTYPSTFQVSHGRDAIHRLTSILDVGAQTNIATYTWQGRGRRATTSNQNGTSTDYTWDGFARILEIDHQLSTAQSFHKLEYAYDAVHNRRMEKNSYDTTWLQTLPRNLKNFLGPRNGKGDVYAYDWAYRLTDVRYDVTNPLTEVLNPGTQAFVKNVGYTLDGLGNRSQVSTNPPVPPSSVTYASDVVNQYTAIGGVSRTHDNNGNLKDDGTHLFAYDFENRLVEVKLKATQAVVATYKYDALGRRVEKVVAGGATKRYVLEGPQVVEELDGSGVWQARYVYEDGIDRPRCMDRADQADVNGNANTTEVLRFHYHQQALGSVTEITQPTGAVVEWVTYDVYGLPSILDQNGNSQTQSPVGNPYLFTGREYDAESGLYFYRARTYDPSAGRFLQRDPIGYVAGPLSLYEYVDSQPVHCRDPSGNDKPVEGPRGGGRPDPQDSIPFHGGGDGPYENWSIKQLHTRMTQLQSTAGQAGLHIALLRLLLDKAKQRVESLSSDDSVGSSALEEAEFVVKMYEKAISHQIWVTNSLQGEADKIAEVLQKKQKAKLVYDYLHGDRPFFGRPPWWGVVGPFLMSHGGSPAFRGEQEPTRRDEHGTRGVETCVKKPRDARRAFAARKGR